MIIIPFHDTNWYAGSDNLKLTYLFFIVLIIFHILVGFGRQFPTFSISFSAADWKSTKLAT